MKIADLELANKIVENQALMISRLHEENLQLKQNRTYSLDSPNMTVIACASEDALSVVIQDCYSIKSFIAPVVKSDEFNKAPDGITPKKDMLSALKF